ncbi:MAG: metalloregulator ArsR/SmtB family transcription factor [Betaproteobacteria bacterium]|nr:metalloregulator ArsR/SmtB family transcription factor [Betaproteobacteria bacterium]
MSTGNFKQDIYVQLARVAKALGHANRLELLEFVAQGPRSVDELANMTHLSVANTSKHLQELRQAGLVRARKEGVRVFYEVAGPDVVDLLGALSTVAESRLAEVSQLVRTYITARDDLEPVPAGELLERVRQGLVTVLDVRPPEEYAAGHVPGAINITSDSLSSHLKKLPKGREVIAYCRGPYCLLSVDAVAMLREKGYRARRMEDGFPEWKAAGLPVDSLSSTAD